MDYLIRPYGSNDSAAVFALHEKTVRENPEGYVTDTSYHVDLRDIPAHYASFLVAEKEGVIIGIGGLAIDGTHAGEIRRLQVDSRYKGKGIGEKLLTMLIKTAEEKGLGALILDVAEAQVAAYNLYLKFGFVETRRCTEISGPHRQAIRSIYMEKTL